MGTFWFAVSKCVGGGKKLKSKYSVDLYITCWCTFATVIFFLWEGLNIVKFIHICDYNTVGSLWVTDKEGGGGGKLCPRTNRINI